MERVVASTSDNKTDTASYIYFTNHVLRYVLPAKTVGEVFGSKSMNFWLDQNSYHKTFSISSSQSLKFSNALITENDADVIIGEDPFKGLEAKGIANILKLANKARLGCVFAIPNSSHYDVKPVVNLSVRDWIDNLRQIGSAIPIYHSISWSIFLVVK